ncbi:MAG: hypothetical protein ABIF71_10555 [Planctomycetota bacterium]
MAAAFAGAGDTAKNIRIVSDHCPDFYDTRTMAAWAVKDAKTDTEKVLAIYDLYRSMTYHLQYPQEPDAHVGTLKLLNAYGWTLCGGQASCLITLYEDAGFKTRYRGWSSPGHTTMEVYYGNAWHYVDSFLKFVAFRPDGTIASQEEIIADPSIAMRLEKDAKREMWWYPEQKPREGWTPADWRKLHAMLTCQDEPEGVVEGCKNSKVVGWGGTGTRDKDGYKTDIDLRPGFSLKLRWEADKDGWYTATGKEPGHSCGTRDIRNDPIIGPKLEPYGKGAYADGDLVFAPDLANPVHRAAFDRAASGAYVVTMQSPFVVAHASIEAAGEGGVKVDVTSRLGTKKDLAAGALPDDVVRGIYSYTVTIRTNKLTGLRVTSLVQHNRSARPFLLPGKNTWKISTAALPAKAEASIEAAFKPRYHEKPLMEKWKAGDNLYANKFTREDAQPVVVRAVLGREPAAMAFDVASDTTDDPAYPRMVYIPYVVR